MIENYLSFSEIIVFLLLHIRQLLPLVHSHYIAKLRAIIPQTIHRDKNERAAQVRAPNFTSKLAYLARYWGNLVY